MTPCNCDMRKRNGFDDKFGAARYAGLLRAVCPL